MSGGTDAAKGGTPGILSSLVSRLQPAQRLRRPKMLVCCPSQQARRRAPEKPPPSGEAQAEEDRAMLENEAVF